jgi:hypothetical protein
MVDGKEIGDEIRHRLHGLWLAHDSAATHARLVGGAPGRVRQARWPGTEPISSTERRKPDSASTRRPGPKLAAVPGHRIIRTSGVTGAPVFSASGERCGRICDLSIDKRTGRIVYALIAVEGELGFLQRVCPAPWDLLRYDVSKGGYAVPADKIDLTVGPPITAGELRRMGAGDQAWQERLAIYYNPYPNLPFI